MQRLHFAEPIRRKKMNDVYLRGLFWILRERQGGGWPPRDIDKVSGWMVVRMLAQITERSPRSVAADLIENALHMEGYDNEPA